MPIIQRLSKFIRDKTGSVTIGVAGFMLCMAIVGSAALKYYQGWIIARGVNEMMGKTTVTMANSNSYNAYKGTREARSNAYGTAAGGSWASQVTTIDLKQQLKKLFDFQGVGSDLVNYNKYGVEYALIIQSIKNVNDLGSDKALRFGIEYRLEAPFRFMGEEVAKVPIERKTRASLTPKF